MERFNIPIALFMFKRAEKTAEIVDQIANIQPEKLYLIADGPRSEDEKSDVERCRNIVENHITWPCEVVKNYAENNRGVYQNIAGGAQWVFQREPMAIFLEDDNFPALSFFEYCKELLIRYKDDTRVLWVCGTNYHGKSVFEDGADYCFTKLMLPCGWASWSEKFLKYYDGSIVLYRDDVIKKKIKESYSNRLLYKHDYPAWDRIIRCIDEGRNPSSWDYQMAFALRVHNLYGIAPRFNQIRNIGADNNSIHGGTSMSNIMTNRFCEVQTFEFTFPMIHPKAVLIDKCFEDETEKTIILPLKYRIKGKLVKLLKWILGIDDSKSLSKVLHLR